MKSVFCSLTFVIFQPVVFEKPSKMADAQITKEFKLLFERPKEPVFVAKGEDATSFDVPNNYLVSLDTFSIYFFEQ